MARIIAGVSSSHVPAIGAAIDNHRTGEPYWQRVFEGFERSKEWMRNAKPDVCFVVYNDHASAFSVEMIPTFALGTAAEFPIADEGWGPRPVPVVKGHPRLASHIAQSVILDEFDLTLCNKMEVDHGLTVPLNLMFGSPKEWPCPIIPLAVNVVQFPPPTSNRCFNLGKALKKAIESYPEDLRVVVFGTGGMSHQISGQRAGLINSKFDHAFLDNLTKNPKKLTRLSHLELMREAGAEGVEMVMWLIMRGALDEKVDEVYRFYTVPASNTAVGHIILENRIKGAKKTRGKACGQRQEARAQDEARCRAPENSAHSKLTGCRMPIHGHSGARANGSGLWPARWQAPRANPESRAKAFGRGSGFRVRCFAPFRNDAAFRLPAVRQITRGHQ